MKKILLSLIVAGFFSIASYGQAQKYLNFGLIGASLEFPVASAITVGPAAYTNFDLDYLTLGAKANYYFDELFPLPDAWDFYAGANLGFGVALNNEGSSDLDLGLQVGGRWFWNETWGVFLELGGGRLGGAAYGVGLTMKM